MRVYRSRVGLDVGHRSGSHRRAERRLGASEVGRPDKADVATGDVCVVGGAWMRTTQEASARLFPDDNETGERKTEERGRDAICNYVEEWMTAC